jgi:hypothetical protein
LLKRAALSRPSGQWNDDDYDVLADGEVVGRIYKANAAPVGSLGCGLEGTQLIAKISADMLAIMFRLQGRRNGERAVLQATSACSGDTKQREETTHAAEFDCLCRRVGDPSTLHM